MNKKTIALSAILVSSICAIGNYCEASNMFFIHGNKEFIIGTTLESINNAVKRDYEVAKKRCTYPKMIK
jgi:hypothetical protein